MKFYLRRKDDKLGYLYLYEIISGYPLFEDKDYGIPLNDLAEAARLLQNMLLDINEIMREDFSGYLAMCDRTGQEPTNMIAYLRDKEEQWKDVFEAIEVESKEVVAIWNIEVSQKSRSLELHCRTNL